MFFQNTCNIIDNTVSMRYFCEKTSLQHAFDNLLVHKDKKESKKVQNLIIPMPKYSLILYCIMQNIMRMQNIQVLYQYISSN